jgi:hypothetical protein
MPENKKGYKPKRVTFDLLRILGVADGARTHDNRNHNRTGNVAKSLNLKVF